MDTLSTIALAMGSSWVTGINTYATVATLGLLGRFGALRLPGALEHLTNEWVIAVAMILYTVEFVADKVPYVDSVWDVVHTFIRVPAGAVVAASALGDTSPAVVTIAALLGGSLALSSHTTKAAARVLINASPEPVTNWITSILEDLFAIGMVFVSWLFPILTLMIVISGVGLTMVMLPRIVRAMRSLFARARRFIGLGREHEAKPST